MKYSLCEQKRCSCSTPTMCSSIVYVCMCGDIVLVCQNYWEVKISDLENRPVVAKPAEVIVDRYGCKGGRERKPHGRENMDI